MSRESEADAFSSWTGRRQTASDSGSSLAGIDVVVHRPARTCYQYRYDAEKGALTLAGVYRASTSLPGDLAYLPWDQPDTGDEESGTGGSHAGPTILLISSQPNPPTTHVRARLLGGAQLTALSDTGIPAFNTWLLVAVPDIDPAYAPWTGIADLPAEIRSAINRFARDLVLSTGEVQGALTVAEAAEKIPSHPSVCAHAEKGPASPEALSWRSAADALTIVRQATAAHRRFARERQARTVLPGERLYVQDRDAAPPAAWRAITGVSPHMLRERGMDAYAEAEHLLQYIPLRFQRYLSELLLGDERVLLFVERPALTVREGPLHLRTRRLAEGMLLVTDRQVLWLRDFAGPDATMVAWGYVARSCPIERLSGARLIPAGQAPGQSASSHAQIAIQSAAVHGTDTFTVEFPAELTPALEQAVQLIARFLPLPGDQGQQDRRVRRVPHVEPWQPQADEIAALEGLGGLIPSAIQKQLEEALPTALEPGEMLLVRALAPAIAEAHVGPRLLALTPQRVILLSAATDRRQSSAATPAITSWPLAAIAAVQLQHSLLGCSVTLVTPTPKGETSYPSVPFNSPAIVPFRALFTRLRLLLAGPLCSLH
jgi:inorganic pyrophosphatase